MKIWTLILFLSLFLTSNLWSKDYMQNSQVRLFVDQMVREYHFDKTYLNTLFRNAIYQKKALAAFVPSLRPKNIPYKTAEQRKQGSWDRYEEILLKKSKVAKGIAYMHQHRDTLLKAYGRYGLQPEYITAIIGIESHYGVNTGKFPVFDTLTTLAFEEHRRNQFFKSELKAFLLMTQKEKVDPTQVMGSYAGAIGLGQFMPSNYKAYAVDFNDDGKKRMNDSQDAIGSVAYYFKRHGWSSTEPVAVRVSYPGKRYLGQTGYQHKHDRASLKGIAPKWEFDYDDKVHLIRLKRYEFDELWYGAKNFYVITRYNHSGYYAMAVHQLADQIKKGYKEKYGMYLR